MSLKTIVKVGNITNLSDARYCAGMGVDMLGFVAIETEEDYLSASEFQNIRGWISGPKIVVQVYGLKTEEQLSEIIENYQPDYLEVGIDELPLLGNNNIPLLVKITLPLTTELKQQNINPEFWIVQAADLHIVNSILTKPTRILVEMPDASLIDDLLSDKIVDGIALLGSAEISPGLKEYTQLSEILEKLETE